MTDHRPALTGFTRQHDETSYAILHRFLWPSQPSPTAYEPQNLTQYIKDCPADLSVFTDDLDGPPPAPQTRTRIRYLDLAAQTEFAVHPVKLARGLDKMVIRDEYVDFMDRAAKFQGQGKRYFLTGQPGIGKSVGAGYFLFRLLASGQSVFFIPDTDDGVFYFSEAGVDYVKSDLSIMDHLDVKEALSRSWIIIDANRGPENFLPLPWIEEGSLVVWTSSPNAWRLHQFHKQYRGNPWYMKPWSLEEVGALTMLANQDPAVVWARLKRHGPVARSLFYSQDTDDEDEARIWEANIVDGEINAVLASSFPSPDKASDHIFLIQPQETLDAAGQLVIHRMLSSVNLLSNPIASRTVELMQQHFERFWQHITFAFDTSYTCFVAGKLVESLLHRLLIERKIDLPIAFGGGKVAEQLELIGKADNFFLETHTQDRRDYRPLYLRPQSPNCNFAAVDAILITDANLYLFQTSLPDRHSHDYNRTLARLATLKIEVDSLSLFYCIVAKGEDRVKKLMGKATEALKLLQRDPKKVGKLRNLCAIDVERLMRLKVVGCTLDALTGRMQEVEAEV
ncbi:hypothetical protein C8F01DRAFT_622162 [Mycena amicta]|nr:hypothetical protein C8F01DRAFT_622162 [Mycena amicta]